MGDPIQGGYQHTPRLDEELARDPGALEETTDATLWDLPGCDGIVSDADSDPDRAGLRSEIGRYTSLVTFPTDGRALRDAAENNDAPGVVVSALGGLQPTERFASQTDLWAALGLGSGERF